MPLRIEDYALIGDLETAALVGRDGSIDWLCVPRFDSASCFAALLGTPEQGRWLIAPAGEVRRVRRKYRPGTLILETEFETKDGVAVLIDFMPPRREDPDVVRIVHGKRGKVAMRTEIIMRFDYGATIPWVRKAEEGLRAIAGPNSLRLRSPVTLRGENFHTVGEFTVARGEYVPFTLAWRPSHQRLGRIPDAKKDLEATERWWKEWTKQCTYRGRWREQVIRSLITLKALIYDPTGGVVAAPTTSLPEQLGGFRNWDYRYCWLRDATLTLYALLIGGYHDEARRWRDWLLRAVAGEPAKLQIMYGLAGERWLPEREIAWLCGYERSKPVRIGNAASTQLQLDVYGEVMDAFQLAWRHAAKTDDVGQRFQVTMLDFLEGAWQKPDRGMWESRGDPRQYVHSKVMTWVAFDRAVKAVEQSHFDGPVERWRAIRAEIHNEICSKGFDRKRNSFVQYYGASKVDAALLLLPTVGFLPAADPKMLGTVQAIERELVEDGLVWRYVRDGESGGLAGPEGAFLACSFWYVDILKIQGRSKEARRLFGRLLALANDVGLLSEEFDPTTGRQVGNFPQAFSHVALINSARNLSAAGGPAEQRKDS
jgi:GH15 family glucan-1,4-alpha-glucosidase